MTITAPRETVGIPASKRSSLGFWLWTVAIALGGLGIRIAAVLGRPNRSLGGDAYYYHYAANLLVEGFGFIDPFHYYLHNLHEHIQTAAWPPLFVWTLAAAAVVGFKSYFAQRIWCAIVGSVAVVVCGLAGRQVAGRRVGVLTALVIAIYPNIWMSDEPALSETITPLVIGLVLLAAYRFWRRPTLPRAGVLAGCVGVAALGRDELTILLVLLVFPLCLMARNVAWRRRFGMLGVAVAVAVVVIGPWVGYNMSRFTKPVFISDGLGVTLATADCGPTFNGGQFEGYWDLECAVGVKVPPHADESVQGAAEQSHALKYVRSHLNRLFPATMAKLGRGFAFFRPFQQIHLDSFIEGRPYHWALVGLWSYYGLLGLSLPGFIVLIRRRVTVLPMVAVTLTVVASMAITFGQTRYRTPFEVVLAILAAVAVDGLCNVLRRNRPQPDAIAIPEKSAPALPEPALAGGR
jgi:4-amino-4-deoxy-L-arabinose transferase-like glycosyltransferase